MEISTLLFFFFQAEDGIRDVAVTGVQTCALPISSFAAQRFSGGVSPEAGVPSTIDRIEIQAGGGYASGEVGWNDSRVLLLSLGRSSCTNCRDRKSVV